MLENKQNPSISVVIPTHNEARNLYQVLPYIPPIVNEVVLVDGISTDDTISVAQHLLPDIRIIQQTGKGKGNALQAGFAAAGLDELLDTLAGIELFQDRPGQATTEFVRAGQVRYSKEHEGSPFDIPDDGFFFSMSDAKLLFHLFKRY